MFVYDPVVLPVPNSNWHIICFSGMGNDLRECCIIDADVACSILTGVGVPKCVRWGGSCVKSHFNPFFNFVLYFLSVHDNLIVGLLLVGVCVT